MFKNFFWDIYALFYDVIFFSIPHQKMLQDVAQQIEEGQKILDLGSGTGNFEKHLQEKLPTKITCVDFSRVMLSIARLKFSRWKLGNVSYVKQDLSSPFYFPNNDVIVSINLIFALRNKIGFLESCNKSLRSGGLLILVWPKADFSIKSIVKSHVVSRIGHGAPGVLMLFVESVLLIIPLVIVTLLNIVMDIFFNKGDYAYPQLPTLQAEIEQSHFSIKLIGTTCAGQENIIVAAKN